MGIGDFEEWRFIRVEEIMEGDGFGVEGRSGERSDWVIEVWMRFWSFFIEHISCCKLFLWYFLIY